MTRRGVRYGRSFAVATATTCCCRPRAAYAPGLHGRIGKGQPRCARGIARRVSLGCRAPICRSAPQQTP
eukprot:988115-Alexandrium_andersonii.AAC.1